MNTWDLSRIYENKEAFEGDLKAAREEIIPQYGALEGKLGEDESLHKLIELERKTLSLFSKLARYASQKSDLDKRDTEAASDLARVSFMFSEYGAATSFVSPELLSLGRERFDEYFASHPEDKDFAFQIEKLFAEAKYVKTASEEALLSCFSEVEGKGSDIYSQLTIADYKAKKAVMADGRELEVNQSNWTALIGKEDNPEDRKAIFEALYSFYDEHKNALAECYNGVMQSELAEKKARGYDSIFQSHLFGKKIPESVFLTLAKIAREGSAPLKKYYAIRAKHFGIEKHRSYDRFLKLTKETGKYSYEEAKGIFLDSIKKFPKEFQDLAKDVIQDGYVDVYPHEGKRTGAYSSGGEGVHPYILLNWNEELEDVFTLAHESGHSVHTLLSMKNQPLLLESYEIFVAEIASTFNEHNLLDYLLEKGTLSKEEKIALLQKSIDEICGTFYRQTLFGEYEYEVAKKVENGEPLNHEVLSEIMVKLYKEYYDIDITEEVYKPLVWAYIPHLFRTPFYVYQYATSFAASYDIYEKVKRGEEGAFENYIKMLSSGGSDYPIELVKLGGVDLTKEEPYLAVVRRMEELVDELEKVLAE